MTPRLLKAATTDDETSAPQRTRHDPHSWEGVDRELFEVLRTLRTEKASDLGFPPYMIFGDASLRDMARRRPTSVDGFLNVHGVGQKKCDDYASEFTQLIADYCGEHELQTDVDPPPPSDRPSMSKSTERLARPSGPSQSARRAIELFDKGRTVEEVAQVMDRALSTTQGYFHEYLRDRRITDPRRWVDAEQIARIEEAIEAVGPKPIKPIREHLGGEIDYDPIHIVAICWQNRHAEDEAASPSDHATAH